MQRACSLYYNIILPVKKGACFDSFAFEKQHQGCCQAILLCAFYKTKRNIEAFSYFDVIV